MKTYLVRITVSGISPDQIESMTAPERAKIAAWRDAGIVEQGYVRVDFTGAYLVMNAESPESARSLMSELPMFPYMTLEIIEISRMLD
jgi:muconolactone D-isomerase